MHILKKKDIMIHLIGGGIMVALGLFCWFGMAKDATDESATGFVKVWKGIFGVKGYVITAKILAIFCLLSACSEFYKFFMGIV